MPGAAEVARGRAESLMAFPAPTNHFIGHNEFADNTVPYIGVVTVVTSGVISECALDARALLK